MPWQEESTMQLRRQSIQDVQSGATPITELCRRYGISRKTGYKWLDRSARLGPESLTDRSHRPDACPHATPSPMIREILQLRRAWRWGARKLHELLREAHPGKAVPAIATIHRILVRHGRIRRRRSHVRAHPDRPQTPITGPNVVWSVDFKGQFKLGNGRYCYPLTGQDAYSRYLLACDGLERPLLAPTQQVFRRLFRTYGLPERIRSDNGQPFASCALGRLSQLRVWWLRLGIRPEHIEPARLQQDGRHERMHRDLKAETTRPAAASFGAAAAALRWLPPYLQRSAAPRGAAPASAGGGLCAVRSALGAAPATGHVPRALRDPARVDQRRHPLAEALGERLAYPGDAARRTGAPRQRHLECVLRPDSPRVAR